jgi:hypothetical protein
MLAQAMLMLVGALLMVLGVVFSLARARYINFVVRPSSVVAVAAFLATCAWFAVR